MSGDWKEVCQSISYMNWSMMILDGVLEIPRRNSEELKRFGASEWKCL